MRLSSLRRDDVQDFIDRLLADGLSSSTIKNTLDPLRVIYRRAIRRDEVASTRPQRWTYRPTAAAATASPRRRRPRR